MKFHLPEMTWVVFKEVMQNPMQDDPDYKGIGIKLLSSLKRVGIGFGLGSLIAIPIGMLMGSSKIVMNIINPMVQILRPVSPLGMVSIRTGYFPGFTTGQHLHDIYLFALAHTDQYRFWCITYSAGS